MAYKDLRDWLATLEKEGELVRVKCKVNWDLEIGGIIRELCDTSGPAALFENIKDHKDTLKELFCKYSGSKKRWYFAGRNFKKFKRGSGKSLNEIRDTYGSSKFKYADSKLLTA